MPRWKTTEILSDFASLKLKVKSTDPGGDYDTEHIVFSIEDEPVLWACGFDPDRKDVFTNRMDIELNLVELTDGTSAGGLTSKDPVTKLVYLTAFKYFADKGFQVVPTMNDYF